MADLIFVGQFVASKAGKTGLSPTVDVDRYAISDGSRSSLVTAGSATEGRRGLYHYRLASADLALYQYVATFVTSDATVDQQEIAAIGLVVPDALTSSRLAPTTAGRTLDVSATGEAGIDFDNVKAATAPTTLTNITLPVVTTLTNMPAAAPSAADNATAAAAAILVTPANKLATGVDGSINSVSGSVGSVSGLTTADVGAIKAVTDKLGTMLVIDGAVYQLTANALELLLPFVAKPGDPMTMAHRLTP